MAAPFERKILTPELAALRLREHRAAGKTVVQCHGCFDIVHPGHIRYLQFGRQLGDVLVVSLTGDQSMQKGPARPYIPQELRAENLAALEFVDWVVIDPRPTAVELLELLRPDVYVKGREYAAAGDPRFLRERAVVESYGGRVVFHSGDVVFSSTRLLESLQRDDALDEHRLRTACERGGVNLESAYAALEAFRGVRVLVVGDLIRDRYVLCDSPTAAGDGPLLSLRKVGQTEYWGGAAAVALQVAALGARPVLIGASSAAQMDAQTRALRDAGIEAHLLATRPDVVERSTFVADDAKVLKLAEGAVAPLDSSAERTAAREIAERLNDAQALIWCDYGYGAVTPGLVQALAEPLRARGVLVVGCAHGLRADLRLLGPTALLTATERQVREAVHDLTSGLPAVAWRLIEQTRTRGLIVSLRKRGIMAFDARVEEQYAEFGAAQPERLRSEFVPTLAPRFEDAAGAQEAVLAGAALTLAAGGSLPLATYMAAALESLAVGRGGAEPVGLTAVHDFLARRPELRQVSRFLPDVATLGDIARLAPPLAAPREPMHVEVTGTL